MTVNIVPYTLPPVRNRRQQLRRPWNIDKDCVLCLMPEINSTWIDYSGKGNDGTINGATLRHNGRLGPTLYFDGVNNSVDLGTPASLTGVTFPYTLEIWVNFSSVASSDVIIDFLATDADSRIAIGQYQVSDMLLLGNGVDKLALADVSKYITIGIWYHWVLVSVAVGTRQFYINGVAHTLVAIGGSFTPVALTIGARNGGIDFPFQGYIDEVRIYDRALEAWEIKALYEQGASGGT